MIRWCVAEQADYSTYSLVASYSQCYCNGHSNMHAVRRLRLHCDSVYMYDSASLYAQLAGLLCHDPANTAAVD